MLFFLSASLFLNASLVLAKHGNVHAGAALTFVALRVGLELVGVDLPALELLVLLVALVAGTDRGYRIVYYDVGYKDPDEAYDAWWSEYCCARQRMRSAIARLRRRERNRHRRKLARFCLIVAWYCAGMCRYCARMVLVSYGSVMVRYCSRSQDFCH
jgi:hypothetical protein